MQRRQLIQAAAFTLSAPAFISQRAHAAARNRVGLALPLSGVQSEVASDLLAGYQMAFTLARANGIDVEAVVEDDQSKAELTAAAMSSFGKDSSILTASGIVGTPHAKAALPVAVKAGLPVVGLRSGASELRTGAQGIYHLRASFEDEISHMLRMIVGSGLKNISVVYSDDAFGKVAYKFITETSPSMGLSIVSSQAAERNGKDIEQRIGDAVGKGIKAHGLMILMIANPMIKGLKSAREDHKFLNPTFAMSFTATREVATSKVDYLAGLGLTSAFPLPRVSTAATTKAFVDACANHPTPDIVNSVTAFEGFFYGSVIASAIKRSGGKPTRESLQEALSSPMTLGGMNVAFDDKRVGYKFLQVVHKSRTGVLKA